MQLLAFSLVLDPSQRRIYHSLSSLLVTLNGRHTHRSEAAWHLICILVMVICITNFKFLLPTVIMWGSTSLGFNVTIDL